MSASIALALTDVWDRLTKWMDSSDTIAVLAFGIAVVSAGFAWRSSRSAHRSNQIAVLADFLREFREMEPARRRVLREIPRTPVRRVAHLRDPLRSDAIRVCFYLDALGLLVRRKLVDEAPVYSILGFPIIKTWETLAPFIVAEREARVEDADAELESRYMAGFEDLAMRAQGSGYAEDTKRLETFVDKGIVPDVVRTASAQSVPKRPETTRLDGAGKTTES